MNRFELFFSALLVPVDFLAIILAGLLTYNLRSSDLLFDLQPISSTLHFPRYIASIILFSLVIQAILALSGLYTTQRTKKVFTEFYGIFNAISTAVFLVLLYFFFDRHLYTSRFIVISIWILSILAVFGARIIVRLVQRFLTHRYGFGTHRVALVGINHNVARVLLEEFKYHKELGYEVIAAFSTFNLKEFSKLVKNDEIDEIIQCDPDMSPQEVNAINEFCDEYKIIFQYTPSLFQTYSKLDIKNVGGILLFRVRRTNLEGWRSIIKRLFDILFSTAVIIILSPIYLILALAIKLDSQGPIIYKNERVSRKNKHFFVYKFRSMKQEMCTDENDPESIKREQELIKKLSIRQGPLYKIKDDPRVTRVGKFIRRTSLDDLPQFFNVLLGSMSIVGPRPHQPREVAKYLKHHKKVLTIKPGITGPAQVSGASDLSFDEEVVLDTFYIEHWSLLSDIIIIIKTPFAMLSKKKAD